MRNYAGNACFPWKKGETGIFFSCCFRCFEYWFALHRAKGGGRGEMFGDAGCRRACPARGAGIGKIFVLTSFLRQGMRYNFVGGN